MKKYTIIIILLLLFVIPDIASAETFNFNIVPDTIRQVINDNADKWMTHIKKYAINLFYILAGISFVLKFILDVMSKGEIDTKESISFTVKFVITTGFFYYLLDNGVAFASSIVESFTKLGAQSIGTQPNITNLLQVGFNLIAAGDNISWYDFEIKLPFFILAILTTVFLMVMMANLIIEEIAAVIMIYVGFFVLALGGMDYTRESAINYFKAILGVSLKILTIILIMGITINIVSSLQKDLLLDPKKVKDGSLVIQQALIAFLTVFFLALLSMKIPDAVSNLVSSAWGNMSALTLLGGMSLATNIAQKAATAISSSAGGVKNAVTGYKDYQKNKEIGQKKKAAEAKGEDTSLNPMFNKQKNASGKAYYGGKAVAAGADAYKSISKKLSGVFGNSNEMSESSTTKQENSGNTIINNRTENHTETPKNNNQPDNNTKNEQSEDMQKSNSNIENSKQSHLEKGGSNV